MKGALISCCLDKTITLTEVAEDSAQQTARPERIYMDKYVATGDLIRVVVDIIDQTRERVNRDRIG
jgi:hypothetical protein